MLEARLRFGLFASKANDLSSLLQFQQLAFSYQLQTRDFNLCMQGILITFINGLQGTIILPQGSNNDLDKMVQKHF